MSLTFHSGIKTTVIHLATKHRRANSREQYVSSRVRRMPKGGCKGQNPSTARGCIIELSLDGRSPRRNMFSYSVLRAN
eukprot:622487-Pyramimonas_sp.AAC.1